MQNAGGEGVSAGRTWISVEEERRRRCALLAQSRRWLQVKAVSAEAAGNQPEPATARASGQGLGAGGGGRSALPWRIRNSRSRIAVGPKSFTVTLGIRRYTPSFRFRGTRHEYSQTPPQP